jgi:hypothetical protein
MKLPDAQIPHEGFFATHFFTVRQDKSKLDPRRCCDDLSPGPVERRCP